MKTPKTKNKFFQTAQIFILGVFTMTLAFSMPVKAAILFQNDDFATVESNGLILNNDNESSGDIILQFGQTLAKVLKWSSSNTRFEINGGLDLGNNQLSTALIENVAAMPGGVGGPPGGVAAKGRIVQLTATDSTAPGCTGPSCASGTYSWDGSTWRSLQGSVTAATATKIVTVGPTARDYTTIAAAATYCNTLSGCEMWIDPGSYPVTTSVDLENTKLIGADGGGITQIAISGAGKLLVKDTFFYELNINVGAITAAMGMDTKFNATSASSVLFSKVNFSVNAGKFALGSTAGTAPTTAINLQNCSEVASDPGSFISTQVGSGLNTGTSSITVINLLTKDPLKISNWPVTIVGGSNVVTSGTITSVPDRTIYVSQDMDINNAIQSLISGGGGGVVKLLVGTHNITAPIVVNGNNIEIVGEGPGTIVNVPTAGWTGGTGATVAAIQVGAANGAAPVSQVNIRNFTLKVEPDIHGIKVNGGTENKVMDMIVQSTGLKPAANTHTAIVFTDASAPAAGQRLTASRNIITRSDATTCNGTSTGFCWVDGLHFDGDAGFGAQSFGYSGAGSGITDSIVSENIVNESQQTSYAFTGVSDSGIFSNRARKIGISNGSLGLALRNAADVIVINNSVETNSNTTTDGISLFDNVQASTVVGNTVDYSGGSNFAIAVDLRSGATPSNDNIISSNQINGTATGINIGATNLRTIVTNNQFVSATTRITDSGTSTKLEVLHHEATANPAVTDDITKGYNVGTIWTNTSANSVYVSTNSSTGAAVWTSTGGGGHAQNTDTGTNQTNFTLNNGNTNVNTTLTFGGSAPQTLTYNPTNIRFDLSKDLNITGNLTASGNTLLGTTGTAVTTLDVNGDLAMRSANIAVANGANNDVAIGTFSNIRLTGPTAAFNITGLAGGQNGKIVNLFNTTTQTMTINNLNAGSATANQIRTMTGADFTIPGQGTVTLVYDSTLTDWLVTASTFKNLTGTQANLTSASIASRVCGNYGTITVTGAAVGDTVVATPTAVAGGIETVNLAWSATVTSANTVTIRACNPTGGAINTANTQTWGADVWQH